MSTFTRTTNTYSFTGFKKPTTPLVTFHLSMDLHEWREKMPHGLLTLYADMLLRGAGEYTKSEFMNELAKIGASFSVDASFHYLTFEVSVTKKYITRALELFSLMLRKPAFSPSEFKQSKKLILEYIRIARENSKQYAEINLNLALYYASERGGTLTHDEEHAEVTGATLIGVKKLHRAILPKHWLITAGGDEIALRKLETSLSALRKQFPYVPPIILPPAVAKPSQKKPALILQPIPSRQNIDFMIGARIPVSKQDNDYAALVFGIAVLANWGGFSGRLMSIVREREGLTYGIYGKLEGAGRDLYGHLKITTFFAPKDAKRGLLSTFREMKRIREEGITSEELRRFQEIILTGLVLAKDSLLKYTKILHQNSLTGTDETFQTELLQRIKTLTVAEVNAALRQFLNPQFLTISAAGPVQTVERDLKQAVATLTASA